MGLFGLNVVECRKLGDKYKALSYVFTTEGRQFKILKKFH